MDLFGKEVKLTYKPKIFRTFIEVNEKKKKNKKNKKYIIKSNPWGGYKLYRLKSKKSEIKIKHIKYYKLIKNNINKLNLSLDDSLN